MLFFSPKKIHDAGMSVDIDAVERISDEEFVVCASSSVKINLVSFLLYDFQLFEFHSKLRCN